MMIVNLEFESSCQNIECLPNINTHREADIKIEIQSICLCRCHQFDFCSFWIDWCLFWHLYDDDTMRVCYVILVCLSSFECHWQSIVNNRLSTPSLSIDWPKFFFAVFFLLLLLAIFFNNTKKNLNRLSKWGYQHTKYTHTHDQSKQAF